MRKFGESESKYLRGSDLLRDDGTHVEAVVTISTIVVEGVGMEDDRENKYIVYFAGKTKGMVLNATNEQTLIDLYGEPKSPSETAVAEHFSGCVVILYFDPSVTFGKKRTGGLRLKEPSAAASHAAQRAEEQAAEEEPPPLDVNRYEGADANDDIPF